MSKETRHIDLRFFYLHDLQERGIITLDHLDTKLMVADLFTKGVDNATFKDLSWKLNNSHSELDIQGKTILYESVTIILPVQELEDIDPFLEKECCSEWVDADKASKLGTTGDVDR